MKTSATSMTTVRLPQDLRKRLLVEAKHEHRSLSNQIEACLRLALAAMENPDLPLQFIQDIMEAKKERTLGSARPFRV